MPDFRLIPTLSVYDTQVVAWKRPETLDAWRAALAAYGDQEPEHPDRHPVLLSISALAGTGAVVLLALALGVAWWTQGVVIALAAWRAFHLRTTYRHRQAWLNDPDRVQLALLQEYAEVDTLAFLSEMNEDSVMFHEYRALLDSEVPLLMGDVAHMRHIHGIVPSDGIEIKAFFLFAVITLVGMGLLDWLGTAR
jgi:hypothetical protein